MQSGDRDALLQSAAKSLAWEIFAAAGYCRTRYRISAENFDEQLRSALRQWSATRHNLNLNRNRKEQNHV
jgi:hypothetical protein